MSYVGEDGKKHQPYMIHRALFGSLERFFGILIEHFAGAFPVWLAPVQAKVIPITDKQHNFADEVSSPLRRQGFRVDCDKRPGSMGAKIKDARNERIQYMLVIGAQEEENKTVAVRSRREDQLGEMSIEEIAKKLHSDIDNKL